MKDVLLGAATLLTLFTVSRLLRHADRFLRRHLKPPRENDAPDDSDRTDREA